MTKRIEFYGIRLMDHSAHGDGNVIADLQMSLFPNFEQLEEIYLNGILYSIERIEHNIDTEAAIYYLEVWVTEND